MMPLTHKKLKAWQSSLEFVSSIYKLKNVFPEVEIYKLTNQLRRATVSAPGDISEGAAKSSIHERNRFYEIAHTALVEVETQIEISAVCRFTILYFDKK